MFIPESILGAPSVNNSLISAKEKTFWVKLKVSFSDFNIKPTLYLTSDAVPQRFLSLLDRKFIDTEIW